MIYKRNSKVIEMRNKNATLGEIAKKFKLSTERVRQIVSFEKNYCLNHNTSFTDRCGYCDIEKTCRDNYLDFNRKELLDEGKELAKLGRYREDIIKKRVFVRIMRDTFGFSFSGIGRILKKDHSTILNLYHN